jgi:hypothetical protein
VPTALVRLVGSRTVLASVVVPLTGLLLYRNVLCRPSVAMLGIHAQPLVEKGQLLVELASRLREFVEPCPLLGVSGAVARSWLQFEATRCRGHADVAFLRGVMSSRGPCPLSRLRPMDDAGRTKVVDIGCHRVVREAGLFTGVIVVYRSMNSPQPSGSSPLAWKARSVR